MLTPLESPKILTTPYRFSAAWDGLLDVRRFPDIAPLPDKLSAASPQRITEFLAGRFCAIKAIQAFDPHWTGRVDMDPDGAPSWPEGLVGSITHTHGFASAAVAPKGVWLSVGIDSEMRADEDVLKAAAETVITGEERRLRARLPISEDQFMLLVFSAKESIQKSLYPLMKHSLEFSAVILDDIDLQNRTFNFQLSQSASPDFLKSCGAQGRFEFIRGGVHTGVELRCPLRA
jgi:enterobactin synthetase component D